MVLPHLKHERKGALQMAVNVSVVFSKNRYCPGRKDQRLKRENVSYGAVDCVLSLHVFNKESSPLKLTAIQSTVIDTSL